MVNYNEFKQTVCKHCINAGGNIFKDIVCEQSNNDIDDCIYLFGEICPEMEE